MSKYLLPFVLGGTPIWPTGSMGIGDLCFPVGGRSGLPINYGDQATCFVGLPRQKVLDWAYRTLYWDFEAEFFGLDIEEEIVTHRCEGKIVEEDSLSSMTDELLRFGFSGTRHWPPNPAPGTELYEVNLEVFILAARINDFYPGFYVYGDTIYPRILVKLRIYSDDINIAQGATFMNYSLESGEYDPARPVPFIPLEDFDIDNCSIDGHGFGLQLTQQDEASYPIGLRSLTITPGPII